jgi:starch synthase (maltosyl-transferring)
VTTTDTSVAPARPIVEDVRPRVDDGRYDAKASIGAAVEVQADAFLDGHDKLLVDLRYRHDTERAWKTVPMRPLGNDRWAGEFLPKKLGRYRFAVRAEVDHYGTWLHDIQARSEAGQDLEVELEVGARIAEAAATHAKDDAQAKLREFAAQVRGGYVPTSDSRDDARLAELIRRHHDAGATTTSETYGVRVERERARFSTWYELFPRSTGASADAHGTFIDVIDRLPYVRDLGADILYLPPIHPIGATARKGRNGAPRSKPGDVGSPWAIGAAEGGHTAIHPQLGTLADFTKLRDAAVDHGIEIALDLAFQCSPDHPWVAEHPDWFKHRPDGSIRYAENPPKKYEDVYPIDFDTADWRALWDALHGVVSFWIDQGVSVFRVDNPHTKPFAFWEWLIPQVQAEHPEIIFLAEAFTRPKVMKRLAKLGFTQSYTYFAWRTAKWELEEYLIELTKTDVIDYFRPNFWPNTPDILTEHMQHGDRNLFMVRALLAGTLAANYGIYGPVYQLCERRPRHEGSEEYLDGEKYEIRHYDLDDPVSIAPFLTTLNRIRREQVALQHDRTLEFHWVDNDQLIAYSKTAPAGATANLRDAAAPVLVVANLDTAHPQSGWVDLRLDVLGLTGDTPFFVRDLLSGERYEWSGDRNFVLLDPKTTPAHIFRIELPDGVAA